MIRICLIGIGKTGKEVARMIMEQENMKLVAAICSVGSLKKHKDLGELIGNEKIGIEVESADNLENVILKTKPDVVVDFSIPKATLENLQIVSKMKVNMVIGTTGFSEFDIKKIEKTASISGIGIVYAPNITRGVNVLMILTKLATILLNNYDFQISEIHYKNKKDSPSGTAIKIAKEIENGLLYAGRKVLDEDIPINSVRAGGVIGKHEVLIAGEYDQIVISHESFSRKIFASGALYAVNFIEGKVGFYEMNDVLNLSKIIKDLYVDNDEAALEM